MFALAMFLPSLPSNFLTFWFSGLGVKNLKLKHPIANRFINQTWVLFVMLLTTFSTYLCSWILTGATFTTTFIQRFKIMVVVVCGIRTTTLFELSMFFLPLFTIIIDKLWLKILLYLSPFVNRQIITILAFKVSFRL
jgi:hypothetical protein